MADDKDPLFVMTSLSDHRSGPQGVDGHGGLHYQPHHHQLHHHQELVDGGVGVHQQLQQNHGQQLHYLSSESFDEDHQSTTSSTESGSNVNSAHRKDHEFIPTRMKTISASKPAADPKQFTRIPSNPLLISAQKQLMQVEEVKKKKKSQEVIKRGDDEPDWQSNLSSWKDKRRKQSEEALQRVAEVKALESDADDFNQRQKISIGKKLSSLLYTNGEDDWSEMLEETPPSATEPQNITNRNDGHGGSENFREIATTIPEYEMTPSPGPGGYNVEKFREIATVPEYEMEQPDYPTTEHHPPAPEHPKRNNSVPSFRPATIRNEQPVTQLTQEEVKKEADEITQLVKMASKKPFGLFHAVGSNENEEIAGDGYGEGIPVLNRKTSAPVLPYGSPRSGSEEKEPPPVRRKSSELSTSMKSRLELFMKQDDDDSKNQKQRIVEPDNTFREKLQNFRKISEPQPEDPTPKGPKPKLSYTNLIGSNFSQQSQPSNSLTTESSEDHDDSVDQLLDDALEESYRSVLEETNEENLPPKELLPGSKSNKSPPTEKPPPPPPQEPSDESVKNQRNLARISNHEVDIIDKQEQEIIASLELEEREHKKYMDTVNAMRNLSPSSASSSENANARENSNQQRTPAATTNSNVVTSPQPFGKKSLSPTLRNVSPALSGSSDQSSRTAAAPVKKKSSPSELNSNNSSTSSSSNNSRPAGSYNQQHWLIQEAEQRRIAEQQMRQQYTQQQQQQQHPQQQSPVYENSNYVGGVQVPPPNQYTNHQRSPSSSNGMPTPAHHQQPPLNENMYANLGQHPPLPPNFQREIPPGPPATSNMRGLPGPQVPPRNPPSSDGKSSSGNSSNDRLLSVSGKKKCSHCKEELGRGAAMIIESLRLFYHLRCFRCVVCHVQLGNGATGTDVRVRNNKLHCQNCYSNDEGLKFSKV